MFLLTPAIQLTSQSAGCVSRCHLCSLKRAMSYKLAAGYKVWSRSRMRARVSLRGVVLHQQKSSRHCTGYKCLGSNCSIAFLIAQDQHGSSFYCSKHRTKVYCCDKCGCPQQNHQFKSPANLTPLVFSKINSTCVFWDHQASYQVGEQPQRQSDSQLQLDKTHINPSNRKCLDSIVCHWGAV